MSAVDPGAELQKAILLRLRNDAAVAALVGVRIYDDPPENAQLPYIMFGPSRGDRERGDCVSTYRSEIMIEVHSAAPGFVEARRIAAAADAALDHANLAISGHRCVLCEVMSRETLREESEFRDGVTSSASLSLRIFTEPLA